MVKNIDKMYISHRLRGPHSMIQTKAHTCIMQRYFSTGTSSGPPLNLGSENLYEACEIKKDILQLENEVERFKCRERSQTK